MMRNASCCICVFHVNNWLHVCKKGSKMKCTHKTVNSMTPKSDHKSFETTPIWPITTSHLALQPFRAITITMSHFGSTKESYYPQSNALAVVIHRFRFFYLTQPSSFRKGTRTSRLSNVKLVVNIQLHINVHVQGTTLQDVDHTRNQYIHFEFLVH